MDDITPDTRPQLILPGMDRFYRGFAQPFGWLAFRCIIGGLLLSQGWPKIAAPLAQAGFLESIGFVPGWFFSALITVTQCGGGALIVVGLLTRPMALGNAIMLAVTLWYHIAYPYGGAFLTPEGVAYLAENPGLLTAGGQRSLLVDGGAALLAMMQTKALLTSTFWAAGAALIACFGGGRLSLDRLIGRAF